MTLSLNPILMDATNILGSWPTLGVLILLCCLIFGVLLPRAKAPIFAHAEAELPHKVLDEYFPSWTPPIADHFFSSIGPEGRAAYRRFYVIMDFWFPGTIASLSTISLMLLAFPPTSAWAWAWVIAIPSWLFDVAENITHYKMAGSYPNHSSFAVTFGPLFTLAKWVFAIVPLPIALAGLAGH